MVLRLWRVRKYPDRASDPGLDGAEAHLQARQQRALPLAGAHLETGRASNQRQHLQTGAEGLSDDDLVHCLRSACCAGAFGRLCLSLVARDMPATLPSYTTCSTGCSDCMAPLYAVYSLV